MKRTILSITLAVVAFTALAQSSNYTISGDFNMILKNAPFVVKADSVYHLSQDISEPQKAASPLFCYKVKFLKLFSL